MCCILFLFNFMSLHPCRYISLHLLFLVEEWKIIAGIFVQNCFEFLKLISCIYLILKKFNGY